MNEDLMSLGLTWFVLVFIITQGELWWLLGASAMMTIALLALIAGGHK